MVTREECGTCVRLLAVERVELLAWINAHNLVYKI